MSARLALSLAAAACIALPAQGSSCLASPVSGTPDAIRAAWTQSAAVFVGTLRSIVASPEGRVVEPGPWFDDNYVGVFEPEDAFKGEPRSGIEVRVPRDLSAGERYLVFAHESEGKLRASRRCALGPGKPLPMDAGAVKEILAVLRALPPPGAGGELYIRVYPWSRQIEGTPVFLEHEDGTRLVALDGDGVARASGLRPGDYRITVPRVRGSITCRWSRDCGSLHVPDRGFVVAVLQVLRPSTMSSSGQAPPPE